MMIVNMVFLAAAMVAAPDGNEWQDPSRLSLGKEPVSTLTAPEDALDLSGIGAWRFNWARRPSERPVGFEKPDYDVSAWPLVTVPCSWQACGIRPSGERFGVPIYVNQPYTFTPRKPANATCPPKVVGNDLPKDWTLGSEDNPVGSYRRDFEVPGDWLKDEVFIRFEGVESFYYLWINGHYVGFSKDSRSPSVYNVTKFLKPGRNVVAAEVYRYNDGSYLECQDIFRLSGILRPVRVYRLAKGHLKDVRFEAHPERKGVYDGDWILSFAADRAAEFKVFEKGGKEIALEKVADGRWRVRTPKLWSAETPNLYALVTEGLSFSLGFREVEITEPANPRDRTFLLNGQPVKLNGVNRAEVDPTYGHHCPTARLRQDLELIKKGNFNHIRNSHCPQPDEFYDLCDEIGIYVMDEANLEAHGMGYDKRFSLGSRPEWRAAHLARQEAMVNRNRNHPCVIMWSLGNEAGTGDNFKACYEWIKRTDPTRPVNYERDNDCADFGSRQYPWIAWMRATAAGRESVKYPFHVNEYLHNLNNGAGGHKSFQDVIESSNRIMGGCLWDFADQGLWTKRGEVRYLGFGGDFGEKPSEGQGILDGIVGADRTLEPVWYEARHVYQPFTATLSADGRSVVLRSKYFFRDSSAYDFCVDGRVVPLKPLAPREVRTVSVESLGLSGGASTAVLSFVQREREGFYEEGWTIASDQIRLPGVDMRVALAPKAGDVTVSETADRLTLAAGDWRYGFDKATGSLVSIRRKGVEQLEKPVFLDAFRAPVGGDMSVSADDSGSLVRKWALLGLRDLRPRLRKLTPVTDRIGGARRFATLVDWRGVRSERILRTGRFDPAIEDAGEVDGDAPGYHVATEWTVFGDGSLAVSAAFRQFGRPTEVARIGYRFVFRMSEARVRYRAAGPWDNYADRRSGAFLGDYEADLKDFVFPYGRTSDSGNRMEAEAVRLDAVGLTFAAVDRPLAAFQVSPYSPEEIILNPHVELLPPPSRTELGLYAAQAGMGSANCGPLTEPEFRLDPKETCTCAFVLTEDPTLRVRRWPAPAAASASAPAEPEEMMIFPNEEKSVFGGLATLKTCEMRFCTETDLWKFDGTLTNRTVLNWMIVKPRNAKKCPVVLFLNDFGNHEYVDDLVVLPPSCELENDVSHFVIDGTASELTRGIYANPSAKGYFPLREYILRGCAVVTVCASDMRKSCSPDERRWLLERGRELIAKEPGLDADRINQE